jgi:membrane dipeptidase
MRHLLFLSFLFSLQLVQAQSYKRLHNKSVVVDTHNDVLSTVILEGLSMETDLGPKAHSDLKRFKEGGVDVQIFSVFCDERFGKGTAFKHANREIDSLYAIINRNSDKMMLVTDVASFNKAVKQKKLGCMIGVEGGHMIEDNLTYLDSLYKRGNRYLTLTWNNSTSWATSAWDETRAAPSGSPGRGVTQSQPLPKPDSNNNTVSPPGEATAQMASPNGGSRKEAGLNDFGKTVVKRMNELGMLVDVSHVGEKTFWDVMQTTTKPVIASHSCAHALCPVPRNLKDDQIKAIGKNGGVIHLNFYSGFVDSNYMERLRAFNTKYKSELDSLKKLKWPDWEIETWMARMHPEESQNLRPSLSQLMDHLDHIVKLVGVDHVGLGSDFDGISSSPKGLDDVSDFPNITKALMERGYSKKDIRKILGENFIRVFKANQIN